MAATKKLNDQEVERLKELSYNLLLAAETSDITAVEQTRGELRAFFDTHKKQD